MIPKYPIKAFDGTNTADVSVLNLPAGSVGANGEIDLGVGVKVYRALLTQTGTDAPVATVIENTLGGDVVWTRDSAGTYLGTLSNAFTDEKTLLYIQGYMGVTNWDGGTNIQMFSLTRNTSSLVKAESVSGTLGGTWAASDDLLVGQSVEILVYP